MTYRNSESNCTNIKNPLPLIMVQSGAMHLTDLRRYIWFICYQI